MYVIQLCFICPPSDKTVSDGRTAGTVANLTLTADDLTSNHTRLDLIYNRLLDLIHRKDHPYIIGSFYFSLIIRKLLYLYAFFLSWKWTYVIQINVLRKRHRFVFLLLYKYSLVIDSFHCLGVLKAKYHAVFCVCMNIQYLLLCSHVLERNILDVCCRLRRLNSK
jgi:hypothetical protein